MGDILAPSREDTAVQNENAENPYSSQATFTKDIESENLAEEYQANRFSNKQTNIQQQSLNQINLQRTVLLLFRIDNDF